VDRARAELRREGADLAITLATRIMKENMDTAANKKLIAELLKESDR
jgi:F0F1-type ATP synthase membrane subunit b/b'